MTSSSRSPQAASVPPTPAASPGSEALGSSDEMLSTRSEPATGAVDTGAPLAKRARRTAKTPKPKKPKKTKIRTYVRRRTEIEELTDEMARLKKQMAYFEHRNRVLKQRQELLQREMLNRSMREALHAQRLSFASTVSMVTQFFRNNSTEPFDLPARLGKDPVEREASLLKMKRDRLQVGYHFMAQHERNMSSAEFSDRKKFEATNGDLVSIRFEVLPLPGARSVKAIIDALQFFVYNIEISISEAVGDITIRENDDAKLGSPVAQHRLVATVADMVQTDTNNVAFAEYRPAGSGGQELGLMIGDAVDEDDLFPYRPETRVRQDMTQITMLAWNQNERGEPMIVMTRWSCLRIRRSDIYMPPFVVERIREGTEKFGAAMFSTARRAGGATAGGMPV